jgi:hypothetical protein
MRRDLALTARLLYRVSRRGAGKLRKLLGTTVPGRFKSSFGTGIAWLLRVHRTRELRHALPAVAWGAGIDLSHQRGVQFPHHRSGWSYAVDVLSVLNRAHGAHFDTFIERTFGYQNLPRVTYQQPWAGICHVPCTIPEWFVESQKHQFFPWYSRTPAWQNSVQHCRGLFALSESHAEELRKSTGLDICTLHHPTEIPKLQWTLGAFQANKEKAIIQVGWWLRKMHGIFQAGFPAYKKMLLTIAAPWVENYFTLEEEFLMRTGEFCESMRESVTQMPRVSNRKYDELLSRNIVFLNLYGSSANNTIVECIARGTPLLVNKLPAVVEYLGPSYPLYYSSYEEAEHKSMDLDAIVEANARLRSPEIRSRIHPVTFLRSFLASSIYRELGEAGAR